MDKAIVVDPSIAGISGDMFLAALISLGADQKIIEDLKDVIPRCVDDASNIEIKFVDVIKNGIKAKKLVTRFENRHVHRHGYELIKAAECVAKSVDLDKDAFNFSLNTIKTLIEVEAYIHGKNIDDVELHETGSIDTIIDVIGAALALYNLNLFKSYAVSMPVAIGKGYIKFSHGVYPVPAPATIEILRRGNAIIVGGFAEGELTTPTGAAILINFVKKFIDRYPLFKVKAIGYGAGDKDLGIVPNIVRVFSGENIGFLDDGYRLESIAILETDIDDVSGEVVGYVFEKLLQLGARDVSIVPIYMKKNRPGYTVRVITDIEKSGELIKTLIEELGTLGVRYTTYNRLVVPNREIVPIEIDINGHRKEVLIKISRDYKGNIVNVKPEYESVKRIAQDLKIPLRKVLNAIQKTLSSLK
jgi:uncharacterized protein (TIGR00299 family) protein